MALRDREPNLLGYFWDPTSSALPVPGILEGLDIDTPAVRLLGRLPRAPLGWDDEYEYAVLCGRGPGGTPEVTLLGCWSVGPSSDDAQYVWCQRVLSGATLGPDELAFRHATVSISHLQEWAQGLAPPTPTPEPPIYSDVVASATLPRAQVELHLGGTSGVDSRGVSRRTFAQFEISFEPAASLADVDIHLRRLLDLITFLTAKANYFHRVALAVESKDRTHVELSGRSSRYRLGQEAAVQPFFEMLLGSQHRDIATLEAILPAWFRLQDRLGRATDWVFSWYYDAEADVSVQRQFLAAAQALEAVHDQLNPVDPEIGAQADALAATVTVGDDFGTHASAVRRLVRRQMFAVSLAARLRSVVKSLEGFAEPLAPDAHTFAERCGQLRNYYAHWSDPRNTIVEPSVEEVVSLTLRLRLLFEAYLLNQMGIGPADIARVSANRPAFTRALRLMRFVADQAAGAT